ncbi:hypothetical protein QQX98_001040 [Neonectria punicea]|uniref:Uncharacterized protein n=1 Tax=Neonectria punicea TaxID=979145 RepID=A0ABR1HQX1_9HYPO
MAPAQRTFTLIPQHPVRNDPAAPTRPMTSKQVQKAYKAATKGPRLTRAERIREEKAEQERIRKEFEKEKASAKARAAREKKKGKELAEKEEKRKKGLPLVSVRPSQETIAWFVRGNGTAKKRDSEGRDVKANETPEPVTPCPPVKAPRLGDILEDEEGDEGDEGEDERDDRKEDRWENKEKDEKELEMGKKRDERKEEIKEMRNDMDPWNDLDAADDLDDLEEMEELEKQGKLDDYFDEELASDLLQDLVEEARESMSKRQRPPLITSAPALQSNNTITIQGQTKSTTEHAQNTNAPTIQKGPNPMTGYAQDLGLARKPRPEYSPPRPKPSFQRPHPVTPARHSPSPSPPHQDPPLSTQAILFNFDDFFPSSSQQARELEEEVAEERQSTAAAAPEPEPPEPSLPEPIIASPSPPPRRFFTSSGSHELMSLALHRSRRTAALEQIQQRERERIRAGMAVRAQAEAQARAKTKPTTPAPIKHTAAAPTKLVTTAPFKPIPQPNRVIRPQPGARAPTKTNPTTAPPLKLVTVPSTKRVPEPKMITKRSSQSNKENVAPHQSPADEPSASQETEYGGDWVDEIALELMI